jgi:hypothetical protein
LMRDRSCGARFFRSSAIFHSSFCTHLPFKAAMRSSPFAA